MSSSPPSKVNPKLRSSCDGCGAAKVKCDRERPVCGRCCLLSSECVYGLSKKNGKSARKRRLSNPDRMEKRASISGASCHARGNSSLSGFRKLPMIDEPIRHKPSNTMTDNNWIPGAMRGQDQIANLYPSFPFDQFGAWPLQNLGMDFNFFPNSQTLTDVITQAPEDPHNCPRESYEIFRDLICPSPFLHAPESNSTTVSAPLDQVLQFNKLAIDRLIKVLQCPCSKSGHRAMVHASIISRILIWYQQAAGWTGSSTWESQAALSVPSTTQLPRPQCGTGAQSLDQTTGFAVEDVSLSIGAFRIENETVQSIFRIQLVLSELRKAEGVIERFLLQDIGEPLGGLYTSLGHGLRTSI